MDPFTLLGLAGTGVNIVGKLMGGASASAMDHAQAAAYGKRAEIGDFNAMLLGTQADVAHMGGDFAAAKERTELGKILEAGRETLSAQRHYFGGSNLDPAFGSPLLVQAMTAGRVATDLDIAKAGFAIDKANALTTETNLRGQAYGATLQAQSDRASASAAMEKSSSDMMAGVFGAATAFLSGAGSFGKSTGLFASGGGSSSGGFSLTATGGLY